MSLIQMSGIVLNLTKALELSFVKFISAIIKFS